jgi:hypothetical protein
MVAQPFEGIAPVLPCKKTLFEKNNAFLYVCAKSAVAGCLGASIWAGRRQFILLAPQGKALCASCVD